MNTLVVVDFELANDDLASVCAAAFVVAKGGHVVEVWDALITPPSSPVQFDPSHVAAHGITEYDVLDGLDWATAYYKIKQRLHPGALLVAHDGERASNIIDAACLAAGMSPPQFDIVCTKKESQMVLQGLEDYELSTVASYFNIPVERLHRVRGEAIATAKIHALLLSSLSPMKETLHGFVSAATR